MTCLTTSENNFLTLFKKKKKKKKNTGEDFSQFQFLSEIIQFS